MPRRINYVNLLRNELSQVALMSRNAHNKTHAILLNITKCPVYSEHEQPIIGLAFIILI